MPELNGLDPELGELLTELIDAHQNPPEKDDIPFLNIEQFKFWLRDHPNFALEYKWISEGYSLGLEDRNPAKLSQHVRNFVRNTRELKEVLKRMGKEARRGYITPIKEKGHYVLTLICVPKTDSETGLKTALRVARHASYSTKRTIAINDKIPKLFTGIDTLPNIKKYIRLLLEFDYVTLRDLKDAFRQLGLAQEDCEWITYCVFNLKFRDQRQAYGVASAAANCQHFTEILIWIFERHFLSPTQIQTVLVHIDDFIMGAHTEDEAIKMGENFDKMCAALGVQISHAKSENGIQEGIVHGFAFNLKNKTVHIPDLKYYEIMHALIMCIKYKKADGKALESICGKIMHWAQFRRHAKILCYRIMGKIHRDIRANKALRDKIFTIPTLILLEFSFWVQYCRFMRTVTMESIIHPPSITISGATDASSKGGGFIVGPHYGSYRFSQTPNKHGLIHRQMDINRQEAHAVLMLLHNYRHVLTGQKLLLYIDNKSVMYSIFRNWSGSARLMEFIHEIVLMLCIYKIELHVDFIESEMNGLADSLSRFDFAKFLTIIDDWNLEVDRSLTRLEYYADLQIMEQTVNKDEIEKLINNVNF